MPLSCICGFRWFDAGQWGRCWANGRMSFRIWGRISIHTSTCLSCLREAPRGPPSLDATWGILSPLRLHEVSKGPLSLIEALWDPLRSFEWMDELRNIRTGIQTEIPHDLKPTGHHPFGSFLQWGEMWQRDRQCRSDMVGYIVALRVALQLKLGAAAQVGLQSRYTLLN